MIIALVILSIISIFSARLTVDEVECLLFILRNIDMHIEIFVIL